MRYSETDDFEYTDEPICPNCRAIHGDAWEIGDGDEGTFEGMCDCGQDIVITRHVHVTYSTELEGS